MNILDLTPEEQQELLMFTSDKNVLLPYSSIIQVSPHEVVTQTGTYNIDSSTYARLSTGLVRYEAYKLQHTTEDLQKKVKELTQSEITKNFSAYFTELSAIFDEQKQEVFDKFKSSLATIEESTSNANNFMNKLAHKTKDFENFIAATNPSEIKASIKTNLDALKPLKQEWKEVISSLKELLPES